MYTTVINRGAWDRLKKQAESQKEEIWEKPSIQVKSLEFKAVQKLQQMTSHDLKVKRQRQVREIEKFSKKEQESKKKQTALNRKIVQDAKDIIYSRSCHGQALKSAYLQSRAIEELEAQIEFKSKAEGERRALEEAENKKLQAMLEEKYKLLDDEAQIRKNKDKEYSEIYKTIINMNKKKSIEEKKKEVEAEKQDLSIITEWIKRDKEIWNQRKMYDKEQLLEYEELKRIYRSTKKEIDDTDTKLIEVWKKYQERVKIKQKEIADQIHIHNTKRSNDHFALIDKLYEAEMKKYEDFVAKGVDKFQKTITEREKTDGKKQRTKNIEIAKANKEIAANRAVPEHEWVARSKCVAVRQTLFSKPRPVHKKKPKETVVLFESYGCPSPTPNNSFTSRHVTLSEEYKERQSEPSPWSGTQAEHQTFARKAADTLAECKYKNMARSVIDYYRKENNLNSETLPVEFKDIQYGTF